MLTVKRPIKDGTGLPVDEAPVHRLNLNLLYPLDAILHAPTLTEAGRRVRLSQSAMSHALARLRAHFGDELVSRIGGDQQLTPLGMALRAEVRRVLRDVDGTLNFTLSFDPGTSSGTITVAASDVVEQMLLGPVLRGVLNDAPGLTVAVLPLDAGAPHQALERGAELLLLPADLALKDLDTLPILKDHLSGLIWRGHSVLGERFEISAAEYGAARHVIARDERMPLSSFDRDMAAILRARRIAMRASSQAALPSIIMGSDLIATGSSWLFQHFASMMPLQVVSLPFLRGETEIVAQRASHRRRDPMLAWFVQQIENYVGRFPNRS